MWSLETIVAMNSEAATRTKGKPPARLTRAAVEAVPSFPFPYLGDGCKAVDETHERLETLFCDISGYGRDGEPALSHEELRAKLLELCDQHGAVFGAIESRGQFQAHIAIWREGSTDPSSE